MQGVHWLLLCVVALVVQYAVLRQTGSSTAPADSSPFEAEPAAVSAPATMPASEWAARRMAALQESSLAAEHGGSDHDDDDDDDNDDDDAVDGASTPSSSSSSQWEHNDTATAASQAAADATNDTGTEDLTGMVMTTDESTAEEASSNATSTSAGSKGKTKSKKKPKKVQRGTKRGRATKGSKRKQARRHVLDSVPPQPAARVQVVDATEVATPSAGAGPRGAALAASAAERAAERAPTSPTPPSPSPPPPPPRSAAPVAPVVKAHVSSYWVSSGSSFFTKAEVRADPTLTFQWRLNGIDITGATTADLSIERVRVTDAGTYTCAVANAAGAAVWEEVIVHVTEAPRTVQRYERKRIKAGLPIAIRAEATAEPPPTYQWRKNGVALAGPGTSGPQLQIGTVTPHDAGTYTCAVTNIAGQAVWEELVLEVYE